MIDMNRLYHENEHIAIPDWANDMMEELCLYYNKPLPKVCWIKADEGGYTGGWYAHDTDELVVVAGGDFRTDSHSLVHEFAHYVTNSGHTTRMYVELFWMVERLSLDRDYMISIEWDYQPTRFSKAMRKVSV